MASVTFQTAEGPVTITYQLAVGVAKVRAFVAGMRFGTFLGDMGDRFHQWNDGLPSHGRRRGDHTAWSSDGPAGIVKAFDWRPPDGAAGMARFKRWVVDQLRAGRYRTACKFINVDNGQYGGAGGYQGWSDDDHLHWSYLPGAVNAAVNPIADYYNEVIAEDDVELTDSMTPVGGIGTVGSNIVSTLDYARKASTQTAGLAAKLDSVLSALGAEVQRDAEEAARDAELLAELRALDPGDTDALEALLARVRVTVEDAS